MGTAGLPGEPCSLLQVAHGNQGSSGFVPTKKKHPDRHLKTELPHTRTTVQHFIHSLIILQCGLYCVISNCIEKENMSESHTLYSGFCIIQFYKQEIQ